MKASRLSVCPPLGFVLVVFFLASIFTPLPNVLNESLGIRANLQPAEAIVVLAGGVYPDGTLYSASLNRLIHGLVLHRAELAPLLVFAGSTPETQAAARLARDLGVSSRVMELAEGDDTFEQVGGAAVLLRERGIGRLLLVTDSQHLARARDLFQKAGFEVSPAPADDISSKADTPEARMLLMRRVLRELLGRLYYRTTGLP